MRRVIFKYELDAPGLRQRIDMPVGARVLAVQSQRGRPVLWAEVDPDVDLDTDLEPRRFVIHLTGTAYEPSDDEYIGTVQLDGGDLVAHVFEMVA